MASMIVSAQVRTRDFPVRQCRLFNRLGHMDGIFTQVKSLGLGCDVDNLIGCSDVLWDPRQRYYSIWLGFGLLLFGGSKG